MLKNQKGITLVALVITIIVLLILAGVTLAMVVGDNGILTRSKQAKFESMRAEVDENVKMAAADLSSELQVRLAKNNSATMSADEVTDLLEDALGLDDAGKKGSMEYEVTGAAVSNAGVASNITITATSTNLQSAAKKDWDATGKKLSYSFNVTGWTVTDLTGVKENDGGYYSTASSRAAYALD